jgi:hypothetical protein
MIGSLGPGFEVDGPELVEIDSPCSTAKGTLAQVTNRAEIVSRR